MCGAVCDGKTQNGTNDVNKLPASAGELPQYRRVIIWVATHLDEAQR